MERVITKISDTFPFLKQPPAILPTPLSMGKIWTPHLFPKFWKSQIWGVATMSQPLLPLLLKSPLLELSFGVLTNWTVRWHKRRKMFFFKKVKSGLWVYLYFLKKTVTCHSLSSPEEHFSIHSPPYLPPVVAKQGNLSNNNIPYFYLCWWNSSSFSISGDNSPRSMWISLFLL